MRAWILPNYHLTSIVVSNYISVLNISLGCIYSSIILHNHLIKNVFRLPMDFFDMTPLGRIMNRFAKDIDTIDNVLPQNWRVVISQFFSVNFIPIDFIFKIKQCALSKPILKTLLESWKVEHIYICRKILRSKIYSYFMKVFA